jgi:16S rRNA (cytosine1402-N4)-methyltransferase
MAASFHHVPVLAAEVLALMAPRAGGVYCDGTLGGGGHARLVLEASGPDSRLVGVDRDPAALAAARDNLAEFGDRVTLVHGSFGELPSILAALGVPAVDGVLVDLGVSSHQFDTADRGFSFSKDGPLDMRMDPTRGETALALIEHAPVEELIRILRDYGEEKFAGRIARAMKQAAHDGALATTTQLARLVASVIPAAEVRRARIDPATRTFQALRIAVNRELDELERFLGFFPDLLRPGGRCLVISFHSLEDRPVKERFRELEWTSRLPRDLAEKAGERVDPICEVLTKKPVVATDAETERNPRARSAKLRACVKFSGGARA